MRAMDSLDKVREEMREEENAQKQKTRDAFDLFAWFCTGSIFALILGALF
jgi:predicted ribosome quality control (RQC) complex YloA/Tae2 family protein